MSKPKGECPCCRRSLAGARVIMQRRPGSHPVEPLAPTLEVSCAGCWAVVLPARDDATVASVICDNVTIVRACERLRRAAEEDRVAAELELWRETRVLEVPEVFALVAHLYKAAVELVADAIFAVPLAGGEERVELGRSRRTRDHDSLAAVLLASDHLESRFLLPVGTRLSVRGRHLGQLLVNRPAVPFPPGHTRAARALAALLASPALLRPARP